jgi:xanthine dehydrogenase small subunit
VSTVIFRVDGREVELPDDGGSLLDALREHVRCRTPKDGCSPQGQCGCCTVWVDGAPRVSCVTPVRRVANREVTTADGLPEDVRRRWARAFVAAGASQCGFCTPGIVMRLTALDPEATGSSSPPGGGRRPPDAASVRKALRAHLCRCTGWQTVVEAACEALRVSGGTRSPRVDGPAGPDHAADDGGGERRSAVSTDGGPEARDPLLAAWRAQLEGPAFQSADEATVLGNAGFADDTSPAGSLVAMVDAQGSVIVAPTLAEARRRSTKVQGRNSTVPLSHPLTVPQGDWALTLRTTWVEPAYLEPDASWCGPGGVPATPLANGGAFGGKRRSPVPAEARRLADEHGATVRVLWSRETVVRRGPKRPPVAVGIGEDGTGVLRLARTGALSAGSGAADTLEVVRQRIASVAPGLAVEEVAVAGPPTSADLRGAGWAEAAVMVAALRVLRDGSAGPGVPVEVDGLGGGRARVTVAPTGELSVEVWAGEILDPVVLRSYCIGAVHQALGWVRSEGVAVDGDGEVRDLTIRSFGILSALETPPVHVVLHPSDVWPVNGSDAVFAATAAAVWLADGLPPEWPTRRGSSA